ncbi:MAG TPA: MBL fold metallo-hydrolase [Candidatus Woesearchaeota archaeon]|nr:MBL fold metallo-hydrolase [Candidatus Woesearchaeota archaeon]
MEMKKISEGVYYIPNPANIGVVKDGEKSVILIDSGLDDDTGKKVLKLLEENGLFPKAIINTHSHADHCGGNRYIKEKTRAKIYAPEVESAIIQFPSLEPLYLFSGASPLKELQNKFLMAQPSDVDYVIKRDERKLKFDEVELGIVPLPGHAPNQVGVEVDEVLFCADSLFSEDVLRRHKIPFYADIDRTKETLRFLRNSQYKFYVPSHAEPRGSLNELVDANLEAIDGVEKYLLEEFHGRKSTQQVLKDMCDHYKIDMRGIQQYYLMNTVAMAYLSSLHERGKLKVEVKDNSLFWEKL